MNKKISLSTIIATSFGVGFIPVAPGTFGSLMAFPLYFLLINLTNNLMPFIAFLFLIGIWASEQYCRNTSNKDPKEIVIDEVVGQLLAIYLTTAMLPYLADSLVKFEQLGISEFNFIMLNLLSIFIIFRVFDIAKPWPIGYIDKSFKNGFGVMFDDLVAAIFSVIVHFFILFAIIDRL